MNLLGKSHGVYLKAGANDVPVIDKVEEGFAKGLLCGVVGIFTGNSRVATGAAATTVALGSAALGAFAENRRLTGKFGVPLIGSWSASAE